MFFVIKRRNVIFLLTIPLIFAVAFTSFRFTEPVFDYTNVRTIIIDPGHGGNDPGAIGVTGTSEKDVNLSLSLLLKQQAEDAGFQVVMTRESDVALYDGDATNKKRSDLQNRKKTTDEIPSAIFVSIHMNKFEQSSVKGAQVFYAGTEESKRLAESIQDKIKAFDLSNKRVAMKTPKTVYLLQDVKRPSVLVECGFLSNPAEEKRLQEQAYQEKLAETILNGITAFLDTQAPKE